MPGEEIIYRGPNVNYAGDYYDLFLTNKRLILYKESGLIFKRTHLVSEKLKDIQNIMYRESGLIAKKGIVEIQIGARKIQLTGKANTMKALYQSLMEFWSKEL